MVHLFVSLGAVFICNDIGARLLVTDSTKDLRAAKKENLANGVYGPRSINHRGGQTAQLLPAQKSHIEMWLCPDAAFK